MVTSTITFQPDWVSAPGTTIADILEEKGITVADFAGAMGIQLKVARELLAGKVAITEELASDLSSVVGVSSTFWINREAQFRDGQKRLKLNAEWMKDIRANELTKLGWIRKSDKPSGKLGACLDFFDVATVDDWRKQYDKTFEHTAYRRSQSFESQLGATISWLRKGEIETEKMNCDSWNSDKFRMILTEARKLTRTKDPAEFIPKLQELCLPCGVAVVVEKAPSGCCASGAVRVTSNNRVIMMLSFRHLTDDHFWFTFFHEAAHLVLHKLDSPILEGDSLCTGVEEKEANEFAANLLVPLEYQTEMRNLPLDKWKVLRFAKKIGVSPGIVVGQMQHLGIFNYSQLTRLKNRYTWD